MDKARVAKELERIKQEIEFEEKQRERELSSLLEIKPEPPSLTKSEEKVLKELLQTYTQTKDDVHLLVDQAVEKVKTAYKLKQEIHSVVYGKKQLSLTIPDNAGFQKWVRVELPGRFSGLWNRLLGM